ncbi:MAG: hypothetical protein GVY18_13620 [Bacteroidetes bacterium]|jgi:hypothetical protein|nr:hypothetical protein [Bacteroidota bacterium]
MTLVSIAIYVVLALIGLGLLAMGLFGVRSIMFQKVDYFSIVSVIVPIVLLLVLGFAMGDWSLAAIATVIIMFGLAILALLLTGIRGLFI